MEHVPPPAQRHIASFRLGPEAVRRACEAVTAHLPFSRCGTGFGVRGCGALVTSELVVNVLRHARRSPGVDVGVTVAAGQLVVSVANAEPGLPDLTDEAWARDCGW